MNLGLSEKQVAILYDLSLCLERERDPAWHHATLRSLKQAGMIEHGLRFVTEEWWQKATLIERHEFGRKHLLRITAAGRDALKHSKPMRSINPYGV